jgi:hypothetical protein
LPKINFKICTEEELWKYVATHLKKSGIGTVLVGGAVVSVYSRGAYRSGDLDFVKESILEHDFDKAMKEIGFEKGGGRHYIHPDGATTKTSQKFLESLQSGIKCGELSCILFGMRM